MSIPRVSLRFAGLLAAVFATSFGLAACIENQPGPRAVEEMARLRDGEQILADCIAAQCATLNLDGKRLSDYSALNGLAHVKVLMLSHTDIANLSDIAGMTQLTDLHIAETKLTDLSGLAAFPNLKLLHVQSNYEVKDYTPVGQLTGLQELAVGNWDTTSVAFVSRLRHLERLDVSTTQLSTPEGIAGHPTVKVLDLGYQPLEDLGFLTTLPRLTTLSIEEPYGNDAGAAILDRLTARGVQVTRIEAIPVC